MTKDTAGLLPLKDDFLKNNYTMKMKIAIIIERANIVLGGAERSVFELASALSSQDVDVHILAAKGQTNARNIHLLCQKRPGKRVPLRTFTQAIKKHVAENQYDIIHSVLPLDFADIYQPRGGTFAESIVQNAASYQNSFVSSCKKVTAIANLRRTLLLAAERKICKNPKGPVLAALSNYVAEQFKKHYKSDEQRIVVIPNGVRINKPLYPGEADKLRSQILAKLHIKEADEPILFLFVANNFRLKGLASTIKALHLAVSKYAAKKAYLVVAGHGRSHRYRTLARKLDINKIIVFLGPLRYIQNALAITDVAIMPTFYDPASRFTLEALAADRPVITTKFNGATDLFVNDRHGKVIDSPNNIAELAQAISHFTEPDNIQSASNAIVEDNLKAKVSISRVARQLMPVYESIIEKRRQK